jgi:hypothetical protein
MTGQHGVANPYGRTIAQRAQVPFAIFEPELRQCLADSDAATQLHLIQSDRDS